MKHLILSLSLAFSFLAQGCANMNPDYDTPKVDVVGIESAEGGGQAFQFRIKLRILNPNASPLKLAGIYYVLTIEGLDVVSGTAKDFPEIAGYSEQIVTVSAAASLINSIRLATELINKPREGLHYELRAKLGTTHSWMPAMKVTESGVIPLGGSASKTPTGAPGSAL
ncbi:LEA type 2 family protein [Pseudomonadota bacterium]